MEYEEIIENVFSLKRDNNSLRFKIYQLEKEILKLRERIEFPVEEELKITDIETEKTIDRNFKAGYEILEEIIAKVTDLIVNSNLLFNNISFEKLSNIGHQIIKKHEAEEKCDIDSIEFGFATLDSYTNHEKENGDMKYAMVIDTPYYIYTIRQDNVTKRLK